MSKKRSAMRNWLDQFPEGVTWQNLAAHHGESSTALHALLWRMSSTGDIAFVGAKSHFGRWHTARHALTATAAYERDRAAHVAAKKARRGIYEGGRTKRAAETWASRKFEHREVKANEVPPLRKRGPASVWELAAA